MTTFGMQLSRCISSSSSSASCHRPAFSHALISELYVITLRSQPRRTMSWKMRSASSICATHMSTHPPSAHCKHDVTTLTRADGWRIASCFPCLHSACLQPETCLAHP